MSGARDTAAEAETAYAAALTSAANVREVVGEVAELTGIRVPADHPYAHAAVMEAWSWSVLERKDHLVTRDPSKATDRAKRTLATLAQPYSYGAVTRDLCQWAADDAVKAEREDSAPGVVAEERQREAFDAATKLATSRAGREAELAAIREREEEGVRHWRRTR